MRAPRDRPAAAAMLLLAAVACWRAALALLTPQLAPSALLGADAQRLVPASASIAVVDSGDPAAARALPVRRVVLTDERGAAAALAGSYGYPERRLLLTTDAEGRILLVQPYPPPAP